MVRKVRYRIRQRTGWTGGTLLWGLLLPVAHYHVHPHEHCNHQKSSFSDERYQNSCARNRENKPQWPILCTGNLGTVQTVFLHIASHIHVASAVLGWTL